MSLLVFTGGSQFAAVGVLAAGGGAATAVRNALLLAVRNGALRPRRSRRCCAARRRAAAVAAQLVIDETTAMARAQDDRAATRAARSGHRRWRSSCAGTWARSPARWPAPGSAIRRDYGLDAMFPAAFLALLAPQLRQPGAPAAALAGALIAVVLCR